MDLFVKVPSQEANAALVAELAARNIPEGEYLSRLVVNKEEQTFYRISRALYNDFVKRFGRGAIQILTVRNVVSSRLTIDTLIKKGLLKRGVPSIAPGSRERSSRPSRRHG